MSNNPLFNSVSISDITLSNRIAMAPLTRCRADAEHIPTSMMTKYYTQRASAGLIICEATMVMEGNSAFYREPGIYSKKHASAWKEITDSVHKSGGKIALQLWHGGRACHPFFNNGALPVAPSALRIENDEVHTSEGKKPYVVPRELQLSEIPEIIQGFRKAAEYSKEAGFDFVEIHSANGYLLDQFLRDGTNKRSDVYGGAIENRARLLLEVVDAVSSVFGEGRVGVRISPLNSYNDMRDSDPVALTSYVSSKLNELKIGYLHVMRGDFFGIQKGDVLSVARKNFKGVLMANAGYTPTEAADSVASGHCDIIAFGHHYISNPDLVERINLNRELVEPDPKSFYTQTSEGYIDYPTM